MPVITNRLNYKIPETLPTELKIPEKKSAGNPALEEYGLAELGQAFYKKAKEGAIEVSKVASPILGVLMRSVTAIAFEILNVSSIILPEDFVPLVNLIRRVVVFTDEFGKLLENLHKSDDAWGDFLASLVKAKQKHFG